jgi:hypothetical protein
MLPSNVVAFLHRIGDGGDGGGWEREMYELGPCIELRFISLSVVGRCVFCFAVDIYIFSPRHRAR